MSKACPPTPGEKLRNAFVALLVILSLCTYVVLLYASGMAMAGGSVLGGIAFFVLLVTAFVAISYFYQS
jgi:hypothetical protein